MTEPIAWLNGRLLPFTETRLPVTDLGIVQAATVTEMIRTIRHQPYCLPEHLERFQYSLNAVGFGQEFTPAKLTEIVQQVVTHNAALIPTAHDLGIVIFATAGQNSAYLPIPDRPHTSRPTLCVHTTPSAFELWAKLYASGGKLVTPAIRQIPRSILDPRIKYRSRLHWYLADQEAQRTDPGARAVLLDEDGHLTETSSGNFFIVRGKTLLTPAPEKVLAGISQQVVRELTEELGLEYRTTDLTVYDALHADEVLVSSTPWCLLPITSLNGETIGNGQPGPVFQQLISAWSSRISLDIIQQATTAAADRLQQSE